jgi:amino acid transporter
MTTIRNASDAPRLSLKSLLIGKPLPTYEMQHQTLSKKVGLAVFASDALSSTAYATEAILEVLAFAVPVAGLAVLGYSIPISLAIVFLLAVVTVSYQQTIHAYPGGGGAYIVARDNLGELPAQIAGAALMTDYILTVSVSISSGVAQLTSGFRALYPYWENILHMNTALLLRAALLNQHNIVVMEVPYHVDDEMIRDGHAQPPSPAHR